MLAQSHKERELCLQPRYSARLAGRQSIRDGLWHHITIILTIRKNTHYLLVVESSCVKKQNKQVNVFYEDRDIPKSR